MAITKFTPDRQPRRNDTAGHMTVWAVLLLLIDWLNSNYVGQFKAGTASVPATTTNVIVAHGLGTVAYRISLTPNGADPTLRYWVSNKTATQFQINLSGAAPVGGVPFDWLVKGD